MKQKKPHNQNEAENSEELTSEKSEEFVRFESALRDIFSLTPEQAKKIREEPIPPDPDDPENKVNS